MDNEIGIRLEYLIRHFEMTKKSFAISIEYSPGNITDWIKGRYKPSSKALINIEKVYGVSQKWLMEGIGSMFVKTNTDALVSDISTDTSSNSFNKVIDLTEEELKIITLFRQLNDKEKNKIEGMLEMKVAESQQLKRGMSSSSYLNGEESATLEKGTA